jgi:hypothetical protein
MKALFLLCAVIFCASFVAGTALAQEEPHLFTLTTWETTFPEGGSVAERDSLLNILFEATTKKNDKIVSSQEFVHYYTADSREYIVLQEYRTWADIEAADKMNDELFRKAFPDQAKRQEFNRKLRKYFASHGDRILTGRPKLSK